MDQDTITALLAMLAGLSGIILGWLGRIKQDKQESAQQAGTSASLKADVDYIRRGVDDIKDAQRAHGVRLDALTERVVRLEESGKQAHKRIDRLDREREEEL
jgi:cell division protein FtsB